jgi:hypothetical protein
LAETIGTHDLFLLFAKLNSSLGSFGLGWWQMRFRLIEQNKVNFWFATHTAKQRVLVAA